MKTLIGLPNLFRHLRRFHVNMRTNGMSSTISHPDRLLSIHYLRAIAAIMVVIYHAFSHHLIPIDQPESVIWLKNGVGIFFVISGFVMVASTDHQRPRIWTFLQRRIRRVIPLYWLMTGCFALATSAWQWPDLLRSLFFIPIFEAGGGAVRLPILDVGWTLNYEMAFYLLFALSMLFPRKIAIWALCVALSLVAVLSSLLRVSPPFSFYLAPFWGEFAAGMLIAHLQLRAPRWGVPAGFVLLAVLPQLSVPWPIAVTLPAALIVASGRSLDGTLRQWPIPMLLGDASYAIYLTHLFVLLPLFGIFGSTGHPVLMFALATGASLVAGIIVHLTIERPLAGLAPYREKSARQALA